MKKLILLLLALHLSMDNASSMEEKENGGQAMQPAEENAGKKKYKRKTYKQGVSTHSNRQNYKKEIRDWNLNGELYTIDDRGARQGKRFNSCFFLSIGIEHMEVKKRIIEEVIRLSKEKNPQQTLSESNMFASLVGDFLTTLYDNKFEDQTHFKIFKTLNDKIAYVDQLLAANSDPNIIFNIHEQAIQDLAADYLKNGLGSLIANYIELFFGNNIDVSVGSNGNVENAGSLPLPNMIDVVADLFNLRILVYGQAYLHQKRDPKIKPYEVSPSVWEDISNVVWNSAGENGDNIQRISFNGKNHYRALVPTNADNDSGDEFDKAIKESLKTEKEEKIRREKEEKRIEQQKQQQVKHEDEEEKLFK